MAKARSRTGGLGCCHREAKYKQRGERERERAPPSVSTCTSAAFMSYSLLFFGCVLIAHSFFFFFEGVIRGRGGGRIETKTKEDCTGDVHLCGEEKTNERTKGKRGGGGATHTKKKEEKRVRQSLKRLTSSLLLLLPSLRCTGTENVIGGKIEKKRSWEC